MDPRTAHVGFLVDKVVLGQDFVTTSLSHCEYSKLHIHSFTYHQRYENLTISNKIRNTSGDGKYDAFEPPKPRRS